MTKEARWDDWANRACAVETSESSNFIELLELSGLDRRKHLRYAEWSGVDFSGCDLSGCDFTGARLHGCKFDGTRIAGDAPDEPDPSKRALRKKIGEEIRSAEYMPPAPPGPAIFDQAELGQVIHRPGRDPHAPAEMTAIADLTTAADWPDFHELTLMATSLDRLDQDRAATRPSSDAHLPTGAIFQDAPVGPQMLVIPAGSFVRGSSPDEDWRDKDEAPQREVTIGRRFAIGRFAVTFDEWDAFIAATGTTVNPHDEGWGRGNLPVINVSHEDAEGYAAWLSGATGREYRLPSEAEWEYACRAGTQTLYWCGDDISPEQANYGLKLRRTLPVDRFKANPWGLYNVHGNVWEWCDDVWHDNYEDAPANGSAWLDDGDKSRRVARGGSWYGFPGGLRSANNDWNTTGFRLSNIGFRLARTLNP